MPRSDVAPLGSVRHRHCRDHARARRHVHPPCRRRPRRHDRSLRTCLQHPRIARSAVIISAEAIEDDDDKAADAKLMDRFADRARARGLQAAWELCVPHLQPLIANLVTEAIPRADAQSAAAAAAIGHDRAFATAEELRRINTPTLIIAGDDPRHPAQLACTLVDVRPQGVLAEATMSDLLVNADDIAHAFGPTIEQFPATTSDPGYLRRSTTAPQLQPSAVAGFPTIGLDGAAPAGDFGSTCTGRCTWRSTAWLNSR